MSNFLESIKTGLKAAADKENNLQEIADVIVEVKNDIEQFSKQKLTLLSKQSQLDLLNEFALRGLKPQYNKNKPLNEVLYIQLIGNPEKREELTMLYLGSEGYPCSIYVEGNQLTANDKDSFISHMRELLSTPSTGQKIGKLLEIAN